MDWRFLAVNCLGMAVQICQSKSSAAKPPDEFLEFLSGEMIGVIAMNIFLLKITSKKLWIWELVVLVAIIIFLVICSTSG